MKELEQYFKALADRNRLRILNLLLHGELWFCDIQLSWRHRSRMYRDISRI